MLVSFSILGSGGYKAIRSGPPIPSKVVTADGQLLFSGETIRDGQNVWQSTGGQEIATIWGHGAYVAPDWSADYLHRQSEIILTAWAREQGAANYGALPAESRAALQGRLTELTRHNTYDAAMTRLCSTANGRAPSRNWQSITWISMGTAATSTPFPPAPSPIPRSSIRWRHFFGGRPGPPARIGRTRKSLTPRIGRMKNSSAIARLEGLLFGA